MKILQLKSTFKGLMTNAITTLFLLTFLCSLSTAQTISDFIAGGEYYIDHIGSNLRLQSNGTGTDLITASISDAGGRSQWKFKDAGEGYVYIDCVANNKRMQGMSNEFNNESAVQLDANSYAGNWVQWKLVAVDNNWFLVNRGHDTHLTITSSAEIAFGSTAWDGPYSQWKITKKSTGENFNLTKYEPSEPNKTTKLGSNAEVKLTFSEAVNLETANTIDVYINKVLSNNSCSWSLGSSNQLKVKHNTSWSPGSLVTILIKPITKSASGASFDSYTEELDTNREEYEFIVDTQKDFGFIRKEISSIATRNNGTHNIPLKVALPTNRTNKVPVHIWVHGGGWSGGTPAASIASQSPHSEYLAKELGIATLEIAYRCLGSNGTFTMAMEDIESAYQWAVANAGTYNFDLNKIFISGGSAGTPLAALFAQRKNKIKAFIGFNGIYNFENDPQSAFPYASSQPYEYCNPSCKDNSAFFNLRINPPATLLLHGDTDAIINHNQSKQYASQVIAKGGNGKAVIYPKEEHAFFNFGKVQYEDCLWEMARFLRVNNMVQSNPIDEPCSEKLASNTFSQQNASSVPEWKTHKGGSAVASSSNNSSGVAHISISNGSNFDYDVQLWQDGLDVKAGKTYKVVAKIRANGNRKIRLIVRPVNLPNGGSFYMDETLDLTTQFQLFSLYFPSPENESDVPLRLSFLLGGNNTDVFIDEVSFKEDCSVCEPEQLLAQNTFDQNNTSPIPGWNAHQIGSAGMNSHINEWGVAQFDIANGGTNNYDLQLWQDGLSIEKGSTYMATVRMRAANNRNVRLIVRPVELSNGEDFFEEGDRSITSDFKEYFIQFTADRVEPDARFSILMGGNDADVYIDWVTFEKVCNNGKLLPDEMNNTQLAKIYPNPVSDYLQVQLYQQIEDAEITVFDVHGKLIHTQIIDNAREASVDVSNLVSGSYFIRIQSEDEVETQKILKY